MTWIRVSPSEMVRIRKLAEDRKSKRAEKRKALPWSDKGGSEAPPKGAPKKRRKKSLIEIAWDRNDALWSLVVRRRDTKLYGRRCRICGVPAEALRPGVNMVGYHLVPKKRGCAIRWLPENGVQACSACNEGERWNPGKYREKHMALVGQVHIEKIEAMARPGTKFTLENLLAIGEWLKAILEGIKMARPECLGVLTESRKSATIVE